jgi:hypothetical protein
MNPYLAEILFGAMPSPPAAPRPQWAGVRERFTQFHRNLEMTALQQMDAFVKSNAVLRCLDQHYYGATGHLPRGFMVGSSGKGTAIRPPRDVDVLFPLPAAVYWRFQGNVGNRQSALLQEVRGVLINTFSQTTMRGDGQVVIVDFDSMSWKSFRPFPCRTAVLESAIRITAAATRKPIPAQK